MYWLHSECGYTFVGDTSLYRLALPEMRVLYAGYQVHQRERSDAEKGVDPGDRERLADFDQRVQSGAFDDELGRGPAS